MKKILLIISIFFISKNFYSQDLWGMTFGGGVNNMGVLFHYNVSTNTYSIMIHFDGLNTGSYPMGSLMQASDGKLYGMTNTGGLNDMGIIFQYDPVTNLFVKKIDFDGSGLGAYPLGYLIEAIDGKLYGMTSEGGVNNFGVLFQYDQSSNTIYKKIDFSGAINGKTPYGSLFQASDGNLYGMTWQGGVNNYGVLFQYNLIASTLIKKIDCSGASNGRNPTGTLMEATDGNLYGMTLNGGVAAKGDIFQYNFNSNTYLKMYDFSILSQIGCWPEGSLIQAQDGKLYGMNQSYGANNKGVLFQYDFVNNIYITKVNFAGVSSGSSPTGSLFQSSNGNIYGMTFSGGLNNKGVLFEFNPINNIYLKIIDFDNINGGTPYYGNIIETNNITNIKLNANHNNLSLYPNPNNGSFTIDLKTKSHIVVTNTLGEIVCDQSMEIGKQNLSLQSQAEGIYFVRVTDDKGLTSTKKVIINK